MGRSRDDGCGGCCLLVLMFPIFVVLYGYATQVANWLQIVLPYLTFTVAVIGGLYVAVRWGPSLLAKIMAL